MKATNMYFVMMLLMPESSAMIWGSSGSSQSHEGVRYDSDPETFNPSELLDPKTQKPEMWAKAISELQELKKKPSCSRLAASMLMNDCQLLQGVDGSNGGKLPRGVEGRLEDYINGYAASLAICDIDAAQGLVPEACEPFRETALLKYTEGRGGKSPHVSKKQIDQCMNGLIRVPTSWTSWTSSRDRATLFCRASRIDIEKDQFIVLHQTIAEILEKMIWDSQEEFRKRKQELTEQDEATRSYFRDIIARLGNVKDGVSMALFDLTDLVNNAKEALRSTSKDAQNVQKIVDTLRKTLLDANVEQVAAKQVAVRVTTDLASESRNAHEEVRALRDLLRELNLSTVSMNAALANLMQRQDALDAQSSQAFLFMKNLTDALQDAHSLGDDHLLSLGRLKDLSSELQDIIEMASSSASSWSKSLFDVPGPLGISWSTLILSPITTLLVGSWCLVPSVVRNFGLLTLGFPVAWVLTFGPEMMSKIAKFLWSLLGFGSSAVLNLPRANKSSSFIVTIPASTKSLSHFELSEGQDQPFSFEI